MNIDPPAYGGLAEPVVRFNLSPLEADVPPAVFDRPAGYPSPKAPPAAFDPDRPKAPPAGIDPPADRPAKAPAPAVYIDPSSGRPIQIIPP